MIYSGEVAYMYCVCGHNITMHRVEPLKPCVLCDCEQFKIFSGVNVDSDFAAQVSHDRTMH